MNISCNWLKEFIDLPLSPEETAEKLTLIGLEVEEVRRFGSDMEGVVVGRVLEVKEHPNADRLRICRVDIGYNKPVQIICGADNVAADQPVPVATVGTVLETEDGGEITIKKAKLRGEPSEGMICSRRELNLGSDHTGIMVLDTTAAPGTPLSEVLESASDTIFDIAITPNRPDATGHLGVARDLAAALTIPLKTPWPVEFGDTAPLPDFTIEIENRDKCHRYTGKLVEGVTVDASPSWLKNRLAALGVRPVNNIVDATNWVMLETGQPLHAFDRTVIGGDRIVVRDFDREITFETLDHVKRKCAPGTLFICDDSQPLAIAGVMGGVDSEVTPSTTEILIESAWFEPGTIRRTAREQNLQTDASYRFERGVDPGLQRIAAERAASLIAEIAGGTVREECSDIHPVLPQQVTITLRTAHVNRLLGTSLDTDQIGALLEGLELGALEEKEDTVTWQVPTHRPDLTREVDLIEEVGRLYDYNNIEPPDHIRFTTPGKINEQERLSVRVREIAQGLRFREIYSNSLMPEEDAQRVESADHLLHTLNPISQDMTTLRPSLLPGFLKAAAFNFNRKAESVRFFETGHVFRSDPGGTWYPGIGEERRLLLGVGGLKTGEHWKTEPQPFDIFDLKSCVESLFDQLGLQGRYAGTTDDGQLTYRAEDTELGTLRKIPPDLLGQYEIERPCFAAEISLDAVSNLLESSPGNPYEPVSKFPSFEFDFALTVDREVEAGRMIGIIRETAGDRLADLQVFDVFEGESIGADNKSIAFRLSFVDKNKTLTINDVEPIINKVLKVLENTVSAKLRS